MTIVLLIAAAVSAVVSRALKTPVVILAVITLNTLLNYVQEARAESSLQVLRDMSIATRKPSAHTIKAYRQDFVAVANLLTAGGPRLPYLT
jgi:magnesium-transporting ATPase (P-type)